MPSNSEVCLGLQPGGGGGSKQQGVKSLVRARMARGRMQMDLNAMRPCRKYSFGGQGQDGVCWVLKQASMQLGLELAVPGCSKWQTCPPAGD